jgi:hypothetical protein
MSVGGTATRTTKAEMPWSFLIRRDHRWQTLAWQSANGHQRCLLHRRLDSRPVCAPRIEPGQVTLAIDTPLSFPEAFARLLTGLKCVDVVEGSDTNPYLFRRTERYLFEYGVSPLSAIKDMIGSQATKGRHVLARFAPTLVSCGVWTDDVALTAIEAYPSPCRKSETVRTLLRQYPTLDHADKQEALTSAIIAYLFATKSDALAKPDDSVPTSEGWIWVPKDILMRRQYQTMGQ